MNRKTKLDYIRKGDYLYLALIIVLLSVQFCTLSCPVLVYHYNMD